MDLFASEGELSSKLGKFYIMRSPKKNVPSLALLLFLVLGASPGVSIAGMAKIHGLDDSKKHNSMNLTGRDTTEIIPEQLISDLALKLRNAGNSQDALKLFDRALEMAEKIPETNVKVDVLSEVAVKLSQAGQKKRSSQIFDQVIKLVLRDVKESNDQEEALRNTCIKLAQAGFSNKALDLGKTLPSNLRKAQAFNEISLILTEEGQRQQGQKVLQQALQYARRMTEKYTYSYQSNGSCANYKYEVLSKIAANLSFQAQLDKALQVAKGISGCSSANEESGEDYQAWAFLGILNHLRKVTDVKQTWNASQKIMFVHEKAIIWSDIAVKMADIGEIPFALSIGKKLATDITISSQVDALTIKTFVSRENSLAKIAIKLAQKQQFDAAMEIARTMTENSQFLPELFQSFSPKTSVLVEIVQQMAAGRKAPQALQLANNISDSTTKTLAQIAIAQELQKGGQQNLAAQILQDLSLPTRPTKTDDYQGYQPLSQVAVALVRAKQVERAIQIANSIQNSLAKESTLTDIAIQLADFGETQQALNLIKNLEGEGSKTSVYRKVAAKLLEQGKLEQALQIATSQKEPDIEIISKLAEKFAAVGKKEQAIKTAETIPQQDAKAKILAAIALLF
jgi:tetratricopeptide (TPR) repeat protein